MKRVKVTYFKPSGKFYTDEEELIEEGISGYEAHKVLKERHRIKNMYMLVGDSGDGLEPFIVPHLFHPNTMDWGQM